MTPDRADIIVVDDGAISFPAVRNSIVFKMNWIQFEPAIGEPRNTITLPEHRVHEILHDREMPINEEGGDTHGRDT